MELNPEVTDKRKMVVSFNLPFFSRYNCIYTEIYQRDLIAIIRQIKDLKLRDQLIGLIKKIDENSEYETDILGQKLNWKKRKDSERQITHIDESVK